MQKMLPDPALLYNTAFLSFPCARLTTQLQYPIKANPVLLESNLNLDTLLSRTWLSD